MRADRGRAGRAACGAAEDTGAMVWVYGAGWADWGGGRCSGFCAGVGFLLLDGYGGSVSRPKPRPTAEAPSRVALAASWYHGNASVQDLCKGGQRSCVRVGQAAAALGSCAVGGVESKTEQCKETGGVTSQHIYEGNEGNTWVITVGTVFILFSDGAAYRAHSNAMLLA